jgi:hypothetical protein
MGKQCAYDSLTERFGTLGITALTHVGTNRPKGATTRDRRNHMTKNDPPMFTPDTFSTRWRMEAQTRARPGPALIGICSAVRSASDAVLADRAGRVEAAA